MHEAHILAQEGERIAAQYLKKQGYSIIERNHRCGREEIDLITYDRQENMLAFVEVKTRTHHSSAYPILSALTRRKRAALRRAMQKWVIAHEYTGSARLDCVAVSKNRVVAHRKDLGS